MTSDVLSFNLGLGSRRIGDRIVAHTSIMDPGVGRASINVQGGALPEVFNSRDPSTAQTVEPLAGPSGFSEQEIMTMMTSSNTSRGNALNLLRERIDSTSFDESDIAILMEVMLATRERAILFFRRDYEHDFRTLFLAPIRLSCIQSAHA
jgi:hypothetical protein